MKYIITSSSIVVSDTGFTTIIDQTHKYFNDIKKAIEDDPESSDVAYLINKDKIDRAKELLNRTGGNLVPKDV